MKRKWWFFGLMAWFCTAAQLTDLYQLPYPDHFPAPVYDFTANPLKTETIELGRALFYDPILSKDSSISCSACHSPYNAFAHTDHDLSHGIFDSIGTRNAPPLFNLAWKSTFMWDGAISDLDIQSLTPISHPGEMGENLDHVVEKLQRKPIYPPLFFQAFGDSMINGTGVLKALAQFQLTLVSSNAKYDAVQKGIDTFTVQEQQGYSLFLQHCNACHTEPLFSNDSFRNNGLAIDTTLNDWGRMGVSQEATDSLLFKVPSLRNLSYTFPYMHDGRFKKLRDVMNHYAQNIVAHPTLSTALHSLPQLSSNEQTDIIAFLLTLDDRSFVFDKSNKYPRDIFRP